MGDPLKIAVGVEGAWVQLSTFYAPDDDSPSLHSYGVGADIRLMWEKNNGRTNGLNASYSVGLPRKEGDAGPEAAHTVSVGYYWAAARGSSWGGNRLTGTFEGFAIFLPTDVVMMGTKNQLGLELPLWGSEDGHRFTLTLGAALSIQMLRVTSGPESEAALGFGIGGFAAIGWSYRIPEAKKLEVKDLEPQD